MLILSFKFLYYVDQLNYYLYLIKLLSNINYKNVCGELDIEHRVLRLNLDNQEFKNLFANVIASNKQEKLIEDFVRHYFEEIIRTRPKLPEPKPEDFIEFFKQFEEKE